MDHSDFRDTPTPWFLGLHMASDPNAEPDATSAAGARPGIYCFMGGHDHREPL
jgi:hypothetical protein